MDAVSLGLLNSIIEQIPAYAALTTQQLAEVTAIADWGTTRLLQVWVEDGELSKADLRRLQGIGAVRALDGRPLNGVLRAYRLAGRHVVDLVAELGADRLDVRDAMMLARLWMTSIESMSDALSAGHGAASERLVEDRERALGDLLDDLLVGRHVTRTGLSDRSRELGITIDPRVGLLSVAPSAPGTGQTVESSSFGAFVARVHDKPGHGVLWRVHDDQGRPGGVAVLPSEARVTEAMVAARSWHACWITDLQVSELPRADRLARHFLQHAPARAFADQVLRNEGDAQVVALLTGHADGDPRRLAEGVLGDLVSPGQSHLRDGLDAFLRTGSATDAANLLGLHSQTMRYRLRRVGELTGRDPRRAWDRFLLDAARVASQMTPSRPATLSVND